MRIYKMNYKAYAEVRLLSLPAYKQLFKKKDVFKVIDGNGEIVTIAAFPLK